MFGDQKNVHPLWETLGLAYLDRHLDAVEAETIAALAHGGVRGNPCIFPARFFPELLELREDHGGNTVIRRHEESLILLEVPAEELTDVDTPEALHRLGFKNEA